MKKKLTKLQKIILWIVILTILTISFISIAAISHKKMIQYSIYETNVQKDNFFTICHNATKLIALALFISDIAFVYILLQGLGVLSATERVSRLFD